MGGGLFLICVVLIVGGWLMMSRARPIRDRIMGAPAKGPDAVTGIIRFSGFYIFFGAAIIIVMLSLGMVHWTR